MKKNLLIIAGLVLTIAQMFSQKANLVIFSEDGDPFFAYVNGIKQNEKPLTNLRVTDLGQNISVRIVFENTSQPQLKQNMYLEDGMEHTVKIKRDAKQQLKLKFFGQAPVAKSSAGSATTVKYHSVGDGTAEPDDATYTEGETVNTTITTITTDTGTSSEDVTVNVNMSGVGISMNVTEGDKGNTTMNSSTSTTVTSSSTTGTSRTESSAAASAGKDETIGGAGTSCTSAMSQGNFSQMKQSVESKPFSDTKMSTARVATKNSCLSVNQIREICKLFSMDDDKLTYAKFAYDYCVDKANFYRVGEVFSFSATTEELNSFLEQR